MKKFILKMFKKREKVYYFLLFFIFSLVVISQIMMRMEGMMGYFSAIETFEGEYIYDDGMFNKSEIILRLKGDLPEKFPEIYSNGKRIGFFDAKNKSIVAETDSVIEIFCEDEPADMEIDVKWDEEKITNYVKPYPVKIKKGFNIVARISFLP